jgi:hypothetical protein
MSEINLLKEKVSLVKKAKGGYSLMTFTS